MSHLLVLLKVLGPSKLPRPCDGALPQTIARDSTCPPHILSCRFYAASCSESFVSRWAYGRTIFRFILSMPPGTFSIPAIPLF